MSKALKTKSAAKKRFRITGSGHIKAFPSKLGGKQIIIKRDKTNNIGRHLLYTFPKSGFKAYVPSRAKGRYLDQDYEFDGI